MGVQIYTNFLNAIKHTYMCNLCFSTGRKKWKKYGCNNMVWGHKYPPVKHTPELSHPQVLAYFISSVKSHPSHNSGAIWNVMSSMEPNGESLSLTWASVKYFCLSVPLISLYLLHFHVYVVIFLKKKTASLFLKFMFISLLLAALGRHCCTQTSSSCGEWGLLWVVVWGFLLRRLLLLQFGLSS